MNAERRPGGRPSQDDTATARREVMSSVGRHGRYVARGAQHRPSECPRECCPRCNAVLSGAMSRFGPDPGGLRKHGAA